MKQNQNRSTRSDLKRISIFVGAYGSGKSEISVNFAIWLARSGQQVTLCDLDTINPFYRSADARSTVESEGIRLVAPVFAGSNVEIPAIPGAVYSVFDDPSRMAVLDIGGEDLGARVLASLSTRLQPCVEETALYMVVNPYRPFTDSPDRIIRLARELETAAGMRITGLIDNANLLEYSEDSLFTDSWPIIDEAARRLKVPVAFFAVMEQDGQVGRQLALPADIPILQLVRRIFYPTDRTSR